MYQTKSGKKFGSSMVGKKYDSMHPEDSKENQATGPKDSTMGSTSKKPMEPKEEPRTNPMGEAKFSAKEATAPDNDVLGNPEGVDAGAVAAEHGPAENVTIHHDHQGGKHVVVSRHPDGHMNLSQHKSHAEAHEAAKQLSGVGHDENTDKSANEDAGQGDMYGEKESDGFSMPRLA
jgi:hypothetical protein